MAISPTFSTSNSRINYRLVVTENYTSIANNTSNVTVVCQVWRNNSGYTSYGSGTCYCTINGSNYSQAITPSQKFTYNSYTEVFRQTLNIWHNADGSKTIYVSASISHNVFSAHTQGFYVTLSKIPRYATSNQSLSSKTETTITMNWSSDNTVDYIWYSSNNGWSWTGIDVVDGTGGSYTIGGLVADTGYNIKTRVRRRDSQLTTDSSTMTVWTYNYPCALETNNFVIGNGAEINIYNPLRHTYTCTIYSADNLAIGSYSGAYAGILNAEFKTAEAIDAQYQSIPNSQSGQYTVKVVYGSNIATKYGGTYTVNPAVCSPIIGENVSYQDVNETAVSITENDQDIVRNHSLVRYSATGLSAQKYADLRACHVAVNGNSYTLALSGSSATGGNAPINSGADVTATVIVTDSRGLSASKTINVHMLDWKPPSAIITLHRQDNYYSETDIMVDADYPSINGNNTINIEYKGKKVTETVYSISGTLEDSVTTTFVADNTSEWNLVVTLVDGFGGMATYNLWLSRGLPIIYFDRFKSSVGINCFPENEGSLEVNGVDISPTSMTRSLSGDITSLISDLYTITPLDLDLAVGSRLTATNDGGIEIGEGVSLVEVSGQLGFGAIPSNGMRKIKIMKNHDSGNNTIGEAYRYMAVGSSETLAISPVITEVMTGDIIYLWYYTPDSSDSIRGANFGSATVLTVKKIR